MSICKSLAFKTEDKKSLLGYNSMPEKAILLSTNHQRSYVVHKSVIG